MNYCCCLIVTLAFIGFPSTIANPAHIPQESIAPNVFPSDTDRKNYTFIDSPILRENFLIDRSSSPKPTTIESEIQDLLIQDEAFIPDEKTPAPTPEINQPKIPGKGDEDVELIEDDVKETEDGKLNWELTEIKIVEEKGLISKSQIPLILTICFLLMCLVTYMGFIKWRRTIEVRYGSRQRLANEDDFNDPNDTKHFSI